MTRPAPLTQLRRALKAAKEAGLTVTGYELDGERVRVFTAGADVPGAANDTTEIEALKRRITRATGGA